MNIKRSMKRLLISVPVLVLCIVSTAAWSRQLNILNSDGIQIYYEAPLEPIARDFTKVYPRVRSELETTLGWKIQFVSRVLLVPDHETFASMAGSGMIVAYALPERMIMVFDATMINKEPFMLDITLKHELCHLLLHSSIPRADLPRWLDEGICQWASGGFTELIMGRKPPNLAWAALSGNLFPLDSLNSRFPEDDTSLALAYEESRSIIDYIAARYGRNGILNILQALRDGRTIREAVPISIGIPFKDLEQDWKAEQRTSIALLSYLAGNLYTILFICAALLTIAVYIRVSIRKRRFQDEEEPDQNMPMQE